MTGKTTKSQRVLYCKNLNKSDCLKSIEVKEEDKICCKAIIA